MTQPPDQQQPQWWQPGTPQLPDQQATGPHAGQWQQRPADPGSATGSYTGQWTPSQPGTTGSFSGPWQNQQPAPWQQQPPRTPPGGAWQPGTPPGGGPAQPWQPGSASTPPGGDQQPQYGGGFQPTQYGGLGAFPAAPEKKSKKPLLIGGAAVLVVLLGGGAAWLLGAFRGDTIEQQSLQDGVTRVMKENYGEPDAKNAQCPANEPAANGTTFDCTVEVGGKRKTVSIRVLNDRPEFEVGAPH